jgi:hypothetical protein
MTYTESQQLIRQKKRKDRDLGLGLVIAALCMGIVIYGLY